MNKFFVVLLLVLCSIGLYAQWSNDASLPNLIDNTMAAQVMPKTAITLTGETYIAWIDNSTGAYRVYLQRLNPTGSAVWANTLLVSSYPQMTWLTEWDIAADNEGNAVLVFQDIRNVTNNVVAYKISPTGTFLWGAEGISLSTDTDTNFTNMAPTLTCTTTNNIVVAWQRMGTTTTIQCQAISPGGSLLWTPGGITLSIPNGRATWPQLIPSTDGDVLMKYYTDTGVVWAPTRNIKVKRINPAGADVWTGGSVPIQSLGAISAWTQWLSVCSDGNGGMVIAWHEDRDANNISDSYVQHISANGTLVFPADGVHVTTETNFQQFYPKAAYDTATQDTYIFWNRLNADQNQWGLQMQKLNNAGERQWSDTGMAFVSLGSFPTFPIAAGKMSTGAVFLYAISPQSGNDQVANLKAFCVDPQGQPVWGEGFGNVATTNSNKLHFNCEMGGPEYGVVTWEDGNEASSHTYAMKFNSDGTTGNFEITPFGLTATVLNNNDVQLAWQFPEVFIPPIGYKIYGNATLMQTVSGGTQEYLLTNLADGNWSFYVTAIWESGDETPPSNTVNAIILVNLPAPVLSWYVAENGEGAVLTWTIPPVAVQSIGFKFYNAQTGDLVYEVMDGTATQLYLTWGQIAPEMFMMAIYPGEHESIPSNIITVEVGNDDNTSPQTGLSLTAYPNPFRNSVNLALKSNRSAYPASISIYNLKGQQIRQITLSAPAPGNGKAVSFTWDGKDSQNHTVSPGLYFIRSTMSGKDHTLKLMKY